MRKLQSMATSCELLDDCEHTCVICLETGGAPSCSKCKVHAHTNCLDMWCAKQINKEMNGTCPACRHVLVPLQKPDPINVTTCTREEPSELSRTLVDFNTNGWVYDHHENTYHYDDSFLSHDVYDIYEESDPEAREIDYPEESFDDEY